YVAAGLCHSDEHLRHDDIVTRFPMVGGHEGAGIIEEVGEGVTRLQPGDHVICSFLPVCGHCRWCSAGKSNLCDMGATILDGCLADGTYRFHGGGEDFGGMCMLGTFSERAVITELTRGVGADKAIVTVGIVTSDVVANAFNAIRKGGTVVVTGLADPTKTTIELPGALLTLFEKRIQGSLFGSGDPFHDIPRLVELYQSGDLKLDEIITTTYTLDQVNQGYQDLLDGKNVRGVILYGSS